MCIMQHDDISELAKGMVPFVREVVAEAAQLPTELIEQIKSAEVALREPMPAPPTESAPPIVPSVAAESSRRVSCAIITRSGELALSYSDGTSERLGLVVGPAGERGPPGEPGAYGVGIKGDDGPPGRDGVGIVAAAINRDGELMLTLSDGSVLTPGRVTAAKK
jgi:hypothetical protein